ncbi:hypothetical protein ACM26V_09255 [Salipaludibacillus sp. HK11]|uniref:hypothetical protein n=1 Tax=Salipaludibacillus sp. HK11 TaxID=3394320 RepID=UPI0039FD7BB0
MKMETIEQSFIIGAGKKSVLVFKVDKPFLAYSLEIEKESIIVYTLFIDGRQQKRVDIKRGLILFDEELHGNQHIKKEFTLLTENKDALPKRVIVRIRGEYK